MHPSWPLVDQLQVGQPRAERRTQRQLASFPDDKWYRDVRQSFFSIGISYWATESGITCSKPSQLSTTGLGFNEGGLIWETNLRPGQSAELIAPNSFRFKRASLTWLKLLLKAVRFGGVGMLVVQHVYVSLGLTKSVRKETAVSATVNSDITP